MNFLKCIVLFIAIFTSGATYLIKDDEASWWDWSIVYLALIASASWAIYFTYLL